MEVTINATNVTFDEEKLLEILKWFRTIIEIKNDGETEENLSNEDNIGDPNILEENLDNYDIHVDNNVQNMSSNEENFEDA